MKIETITHDSGDQLPLLLDDSGLPIPAPNEFIIGRRHLSSNTLIRNLRELAVLYRWFYKEDIDLGERVSSAVGFNEAEIKGGMIEALRRDQDSRGKVKKITVKPNTFNQRLTTVRQFLVWSFNVELGLIPREEKYDRVRESKSRLLEMLDAGFMNATPSNPGARKGLRIKEIDFLLELIDPRGPNLLGINPAVRFRNYISVMIMLYYGLRPGELLSLRVEDVQIGAISSISVNRRPPDPSDTRRPRPKIKRNGRILPIEDPRFSRLVDEYILTWREDLEANSQYESDYLILSDEGNPLSQSTLTQFFQILRKKFPKELPEHLTAKALRHTFSSDMERILRNAGLGEDDRKKSLAYLRGDSSLHSQDVYIEQEIKERSDVALKEYQQHLYREDLPW